MPDVIEEDGLLKSAAKVGADLKAALADRKRSNPIIGDVRGKGLFIGVEIVQPDDSVPDQDRAASICNRLKDRGFFDQQRGRLQKRGEDPSATGVRR